MPLQEQRSAPTMSDVFTKKEVRSATIRPDTFGLSSIELERIVTLKEAARLSSESIDTLRRRHRDKIIQLSPRRQGMRVKHALMLSAS
jgi:hypothetical protein